MLVVNEIPRIFLFETDGNQTRLSDPDNKLSPEAVMNFYSHTYPVLLSAKIEGPEFNNDELQYQFISTIGTKG
jgi:PRTRC genetic system protein C